MNRRRSLLNVSTAISFKMITFLGSFLVRRYLIRLVGNDVNGLNSLYISIIGVLSVADLGIGEAITFCMYKPIVNNDIEKVSAFYNLFKHTYIIIGGIIAITGCMVMPFLPYLAKGYTFIDSDLYLTYGLMLTSTVITYFFSAKTSLMIAYRDNYITTTISSCGVLLQQGLQIVALLVTRSFVWYLLCRIISVAIQWIVTEIITRKKYKNILCNNTFVNKNDKLEVIKNVKAVFMHRIGGVLVNTIDSLIISSFIGITLLGKYSNYTVIMTSMMGTISLIFSPLISTIGHIYVQNKEAFKKHYNIFFILNFLIGCIFFLGYYSIIDDLIILLFGEGLEMDKSISFIITVNFFVQFMRQSTLTFRDASGTFYYDRWKPLIEGVLNLILSILFVMLLQNMGKSDLAVVGVLFATIITNLGVCHIVEPYVLYKHAFGSSVRKHLALNFSLMACFVILLIALDCCMISTKNKLMELFANGSISVVISALVVVITLKFNIDFRSYVVNFINARKMKGKNKK